MADPHERRGSALTWVLWLFVLASATAVMFSVRGHLDKAHIALGFLLVVLVGSADGGRALGVSLAVLAFLLFNFLFLPPFYALVVGNPLDWLVLVAFLTTGIVGAQLLNRAQERAETARQRTMEVERLSALGAEALNAGRAEDALRAIAEVIRSTIDVAVCDILVPAGLPPRLVVTARAGALRRPLEEGSADINAPWSLEAWVAEKHEVAAERTDGTKWIGTGDHAKERLQWPLAGTEIMTLLVPLTVGERTVGVLRVAHDKPFTIDPNRAQFLSALSYYASLGVERVRLVAEADRAEAFRQADTLKSAIIAGLSHDLRTPLTTIKAAAHALRERGAGEAKLIEEEADRLGRLVADLLDLSRLNAGAMPMRPEINAAEDLVGAALKRVAGLLGPRRVVVTPVQPTLGSAHEPPVVVGRFDFVHALRAMVNLLENAAKYGSVDEPIELTVERAAGEVRFVVADRGPGVAPDERERIFEAFYRAPGIAPDVGGAGLGLAIARRLAVEQGGDVRYEPRPGGGSQFTLALPSADSSIPNEALESAG